MRENITMLLVLIMLTSLLGGCWSRKEVTEIAIVLGAGVDLTEEGQLRLTVQIANPGAFAAIGEGSGEEKETTNWVVSAEGQTIEEAQRYLAKRVSREIFWDHCLILVLGEELARKGTDMVTNFFHRSREPRETMWVLIAKGEAQDFLKTYSDLEKTSAQAASILTRMRNGYSVQTWEFAEMLASKGIQPVATRVEVKETAITPGPGQEMKVHKQVEISGVGIFKEQKLIGWLDDEEASGLLWLRSEPVKEVITVPSPGEADKEVSIKIRRGSTQVVPEYDGRNLRFTIKVQAEGGMIEQQSREDLAKPEMITALGKEMAEEIKKRVYVALEKAQREYGVDIFGFGNAFHRKYKKTGRN